MWLLVLGLELAPVSDCLEAGQDAALGERHIPLCDAAHTQVTPQHKAGCQSPGKVPLVRGYPRFAAKAPTPMDIVRMFRSHLGALVLRCYTPPYQHKVWLPVPSCLRCGSEPV